MKTPCKDCEDRHAACWSGYERYKIWKTEKDAAKNKVAYERLRMERIWKGAK
ncbi:MAG: hypothetical protein J6S14_02400 [Clostridia bacterium]|nr:hypothetical protein [Clostridia bacterium]